MLTDEISLRHSSTHLNKYDVEFSQFRRNTKFKTFITPILFSVVFEHTVELCKIVIERIWYM